MSSTHITMRIEAEMLVWVDEVARVAGRTRAWVITEALREKRAQAEGSQVTHVSTPRVRSLDEVTAAWKCPDCGEMMLGWSLELVRCVKCQKNFPRKG
jgi:predicted RNA-binding Zn-ribbon protein involved in translation (DUF1610 family)